MNLNPQPESYEIASVEKAEAIAEVMDKTLDDNPQLKQSLDAFRQTDHGEKFNNFDLF